MRDGTRYGASAMLLPLRSAAPLHYAAPSTPQLCASFLDDALLFSLFPGPLPRLFRPPMLPPLSSLPLVGSRAPILAPQMAPPPPHFGIGGRRDYHGKDITVNIARPRDAAGGGGGGGGGGRGGGGGGYRGGGGGGGYGGGDGYGGGFRSERRDGCARRASPAAAQHPHPSSAQCALQPSLEASAPEDRASRLNRV